MKDDNPVALIRSRSDKAFVKAMKEFDYLYEDIQAGDLDAFRRAFRLGFVYGFIETTFGSLPLPSDFDGMERSDHEASAIQRATLAD